MNRWMTNLWPILRSAVGLVIIIIIASIISPLNRDGWPIFLTATNWIIIVRQMSEIGILALAMTFVILTAGIDLSVGSVLALGATLSAIVLMWWEPQAGNWMQISLAVLAAVAACGLVGAINGGVIAQFHVQPFVVTLATMIGIRGLAKWSSNNNNVGLSYDDSHVSAVFSSTLGHPWVVISIFLGLAAIFAVVLGRTVFGRYIRALGDNAQAARYAGLPIKRVQIAVYTITGVMAGIAGVIHCAQNRQGNPNDGMAYELDAIAAVVIGGTSLMGGKGSIIGTIIGTIILGVITNILNLKGIDENVKWMTKAVIIILAVLMQQPGTFNTLFGWMKQFKSPPQGV